MGLGEDLRQAARAFLARGVPISIIDVDAGPPSPSCPDLAPFLTDGYRYPVTLFLMSPFSFGELCQRDGAKFSGSYKIGNFLWELMDFPSRWQDVLSGVEEIWVPTRFVAAIYRRLGMKSVYLNPTPAMPLAGPAGDFRAALGYPDSTFVFGFMFDLHSTIRRKNPLAVVRAFQKARLLVPWRVDMALIIKVHRATMLTDDLIELREVCASIENVRLYEETLTADELVGFYHALDAYVSLHRSEGLGRTILEAAQLGLPTLCTEYSGARDIIELSMVQGVPYLEVPCQLGDYPYAEGSVWAEASIESAAVMMARLVRLGRHRLGPPVQLNAHFSADAFVERSLERFIGIGAIHR